MSHSARRKYDVGPVDDLEVSVFTDRRGVSHKYITVQGVKYSLPLLLTGFSPDPRKNFPQVQAMTTRPDDVIICAYMKAGTHWLWEITSMLLKGRAEYDTRPKEELMLEFHEPREFDEVASPRILNTHMPFHVLPDNIRSGQHGKIIFIQRNPKDVIVSQYNHLSKLSALGYDYGDFHDFVDFKLNGEPSRFSWFDYTKHWEKVIKEHNLPIHCMTYEQLKKTPQEEILRLATFLEVECSKDLADKIAQKCSFSQLKHANNAVKVDPNPEMKEKLEMYRKGEVGDWKNWFTVAESEAFDQLYKKEMSDSQFTYVYE